MSLRKQEDYEILQSVIDELEKKRNNIDSQINRLKKVLNAISPGDDNRKTPRTRLKSDFHKAVSKITNLR